MALKARTRTLSSLSSKDFDKLKRICADVVNDEVWENRKKDAQLIEIVIVKYVMVELHEKFGWGRKRCLYFLSHWRTYSRRSQKFNTMQEQNEMLSEKLKFLDLPEEFFEKITEQENWEETSNDKQ